MIPPVPSPDGTNAAGPSRDPEWSTSRCLAGLALALSLLASWLVPVTRSLWDMLDAAVFGFVNPPLASAGAWQTFWAVANWRPFDLVAAAVVLAFVLAWLRSESVDRIDTRIAQFLAFCLILLIGKALEHLLLDITGYRRQSPTLVYPEAVRLSELVTWIRVKDRGSTVFPGDHAFVIFATIGFIRIHMGRRAGWLAALALTPFVLPRLVAGAHWLTDLIIGGLGMALVLLSISYATPFAARLAMAIEKHLPWLLRFTVWAGTRTRVLRSPATVGDR